MRKIKICTPVVGKNLKEFLKNLDQVQDISEMVELKVDEIKNLTEKDLQIIREKTIKESIFTSRNKKLIIKGLDLGFDFVDIDLLIISKIDLSKQGKNKIILSFHDFKKTPNTQDLDEITNKMKRFKTGVIKITTMVKTDKDVKNLLKILLNKEKNERMIIIGMGEKGKVIRILGPLLGSFLTFASTRFGESASGQIDILKLKKIYERLIFNY